MQEGTDSRLGIRNNGQLSIPNLKICLESVDFFRRMLNNLSVGGLKNTLNSISRKLQIKEYEADAVIYTKGDSSKDLYFVISGEVGAFIIVNNVLKEIRTFGHLQGFGDAQTVSKTNRMFATKAKQPSVVAVLKSSDFSQLLDDYQTRIFFAKMTKLQNNSLLKTLTKGHLQLIAHNTVEVSLNRGHILYNLGDNSENIFLIDKGQIRLFRDSDKKQIEVCSIEDGEIVGQVEVFLDIPRSTSASCTSQCANLFKINKKLLLSQINPLNYSDLQRMSQQKQAKRQQRFQKFQERRMTIEDPSIRLEKIGKLLEKGRELADKRYQELDDGKVYGSLSEAEIPRRIDRLIAKKKKIIEENYNISLQKASKQKHILFDYKRQLRPKVLHTRSQLTQFKPKRTMTENPQTSKARKSTRLDELRTINRLSLEEQACLIFREPLHSAPRLPSIRKKSLKSMFQ